MVGRKGPPEDSSRFHRRLLVHLFCQLGSSLCRRRLLIKVEIITMQTKSSVNLYHTTFFLFVTFLFVLPTTFSLAQWTKETKPQVESSITTPTSRFGLWRRQRFTRELRRRNNGLPIQTSLYLSGNYSTDVSFLMGGGSLTINRGKYSWQNQFSYRANWVQATFGTRTNQRQQGSNEKVSMQDLISQQRQRLGLPTKAGDRSIPPQAITQLMENELSTNRLAHLLSGETRLDHMMGQKIFLFGLSSLRVDTRSDNRFFLGVGVGSLFFSGFSLDMGIGLTRLFGTTQSQPWLDEISSSTNLLSALSTVQYQYSISSNMSIYLNGRGYWYPKQQTVSGQLQLGTNIRFSRQVFLSPIVAIEYLGIEQSNEPFLYQVQANLSYAFPGLMLFR